MTVHSNYFAAAHGHRRTQSGGGTPPPSAGDGTASEWDLALGINPNPYPGIPKAFPSAEGYGRGTEGARHNLSGNADVYFVTNGNDTPGSSTAGELRYALEQSGNRIVIILHNDFIDLQDWLQPTNGNCTVYNYGGSILRWYPTSVNSKNEGGATLKVRSSQWIFRGLRVYRGYNPDTLADLYDLGITEGDSLSIGRTQSNTESNIVLDHCEGAFSIDELGGCYHSRNITSQNTMYYYPIHTGWHASTQDPTHGKGTLWYGGNISQVRDWWHTVEERNIMGNPNDGPIDGVNCLRYNAWDYWGEYRVGTPGGVNNFSLINCTARSGPVYDATTNDTYAHITSRKGTSDDTIQLFASGNVNDGSPNPNNLSSVLVRGSAQFTMASEKQSSMDYFVRAAADAEDFVANYAGLVHRYNTSTFALEDVRSYLRKRAFNEYVSRSGNNSLFDESDVYWDHTPVTTPSEASFKSDCEAWWASESQITASSFASDAGQLETITGADGITREVLAVEAFLWRLTPDEYNL